MRLRVIVVGLLLLVVLAAGGIVTLEARRSAKAAEANAALVLRDYASFAAWNYARAASRGLEQAFNTAISGPSAAVSPRHAMPSTGNSCDCHTASAGVVARFQLRIADRTLIGDRPGDPRVRTLVERYVTENHHDDADPRKLRFLILPDEGGGIAWHLHETHDGADAIAHGVLVDSGFLETALRRASEEALLPPTLVSSGEVTRLLAVKASSTDGRILFASASPAWEPATAADAATPGLTISASMVREAAPDLIIGGLPRSRLLLVYALLGVAFALVITAGYQMHRQAELSRMRADFVSGVSHELRTPLAQIRMFAETLRLGRVRTPMESSRAMDVILQETQRLTLLVDKVLTFTRSERPAHTIERGHVALSEFARGLVQDLQPLAAAREAHLLTAIEPGVEANIDANALRQVLVNLIDNALKYGPPGQTVTVGLRRRESLAQLWVEDEGPGISAADVSHIWKPFWRRAKSGQGGSGIGLSIVRDLVHLHGGNVSLDRSSARGARFVVSLPLALARLPSMDMGAIKQADPVSLA